MSRRLPIILVSVAVAAGAIGYVATRPSKDSIKDDAGTTATGGRASRPGASGGGGVPGTVGPSGEPGSATPSRPGDPPGGTGGTGVPGTTITPGTGVPGPMSPGTGGTGVPGTPGSPDPSDPAAPGAAERVEPRIYVMDDGSVVRDHRRGGGSPPLATAPLPPERRNMNPLLTTRVYQVLAPRVATLILVARRVEQRSVS